MNTGSGSNINYIIRGSHSILVVLDNDNRISEVAKPFKSAYKPVVITLMKAYARFIKNIKNTH